KREKKTERQLRPLTDWQQLDAGYQQVTASDDREWRKVWGKVVAKLPADLRFNPEQLSKRGKVLENHIAQLWDAFKAQNLSVPFSQWASTNWSTAAPNVFPVLRSGHIRYFISKSKSQLVQCRAGPSQQRASVRD